VPVKWERVAANLHKAGWSLGWVSALDLEGRTIWIVDAHGYGKRFVVRADEKLTAFVELLILLALSRANGTPNRRFSDHLPLLFKPEIEKELQV